LFSSPVYSNSEAYPIQQRHDGGKNKNGNVRVAPGDDEGFSQHQDLRDFVSDQGIAYHREEPQEESGEMGDDEAHGGPVAVVFNSAPGDGQENVQKGRPVDFPR
jgi:hypothetical protein